MKSFNSATSENQALEQAVATIASESPENRDLREAVTTLCCLSPNPEQRQILIANWHRHLARYRRFRDGAFWSYIRLYNAYCAKDDMSHLMLFLGENELMLTWQTATQCLIDHLMRNPEAILDSRLKSRMFDLFEDVCDYQRYMNTPTNTNFGLNLLMFQFLAQPSQQHLIVLFLAPQHWLLMSQRIRTVAEGREKRGLPTEDIRHWEKRLLESYKGRQS